MTSRLKKWSAALAIMLASTAALAAGACCTGIDCCEEAVMPCCD